MPHTREAMQASVKTTQYSKKTRIARSGMESQTNFGSAFELPRWGASEEPA